MRDASFWKKIFGFSMDLMRFLGARYLRVDIWKLENFLLLNLKLVLILLTPTASRSTQELARLGVPDEVLGGRLLGTRVKVASFIFIRHSFFFHCATFENLNLTFIYYWDPRKILVHLKITKFHFSTTQIFQRFSSFFSAFPSPIFTRKIWRIFNFFFSTGEEKFPNVTATENVSRKTDEDFFFRTGKISLFLVFLFSFSVNIFPCSLVQNFPLYDDDCELEKISSQFFLSTLSKCFTLPSQRNMRKVFPNSAFSSSKLSKCERKKNSQWNLRKNVEIFRVSLSALPHENELSTLSHNFPIYRHCIVLSPHIIISLPCVHGQLSELCQSCDILTLSESFQSEVSCQVGMRHVRIPRELFGATCSCEWK